MCSLHDFHLDSLVSQPHERRLRAVLPQVEVEMLWKAKEEGLARYGTCVDSNSISSRTRSILCDTRKHQASLSLSRQRSCARHPTQDTVETSKTDRHPPTRPHAPSPAFTPPLPPIHHCDTLPARLSPTGKSLHLYLSFHRLDLPYRCCIPKQTPLASIPPTNSQAHDSPDADGLALLLNKRLIDRLRIASQPRAQHGGLRSA